MELIGHFLGILAIIVFFLSYQVFNKKKLIAMQAVATGLLCLQYFLIGAYSGFALNIVCLIRNLVYVFLGKKGKRNALLSILVAIAMIVVSAFSWEGYHSLFIMSGLVINSVCMGVCSAQGLRKSLIVSSGLIIIYDIFSHSYSGIINESISIISAIIGIVRYIKAQKKGDKNEG